MLLLMFIAASFTPFPAERGEWREATEGRSPWGLWKNPEGEFSISPFSLPPFFVYKN